MNHRFTLDGSERLEKFLDELCRESRDAIRQIIPASKLVCILLGGGYGRGEGGVLRKGNQDLPYNDLEFYVVHGMNFLIAQKLYNHSLHQLATKLSKKAGIDVEFKLLSLSQLERSGVSMFYYDLISRHYLVDGEEECLKGCEHHRAAHRIPLHEATRLLMNRCSGLLFSQAKLEATPFTAEEADFIGRNIAKAKLALGDVLLTSKGEYHWSCLERHKRLTKLPPEQGLPEFESIVEMHEEGVEFKLHPYLETKAREVLESELEQIKGVAAKMWLWLEERRLQQRFGSVSAYAFHEECKCPETNPHKNRLINLKFFGASGVFSSKYPRERLLRSLPVLLWDENVKNSPEISRRLQRELAAPSDDFAVLNQNYRRIWESYN